MQPEGIVPVQQLSAAQLAAVDQLAARSDAHDGGHVRLNRDVLVARSGTGTSDFLFYADGQIVGFVPIFTFNSTETEISGVVDPSYRRRGIATRLVQVARAEARWRGSRYLLFMVERSSASGKGFVSDLGATLQHAEYAMTLTAPAPVQMRHPALVLRRAQDADAPAMTAILAAAFKDDLEDPATFVRAMAGHPHHHWYVAALDGTVIGLLNAQMHDDSTGIYGFAVAPDRQGQGFGRQMLGQTVADLRAAGQQHITLEVDTDNEHALALYTACGFTQTTVYDYYRLHVAE
jgi:mycothiol synthase